VRILGIDCGSHTTGWGVIESDGTRHTFVGAGAIAVPARLAFPERLCEIGRELRRIIAEYHPDSAAVEDTFHSLNARSALRLTHIRGVAMFLLAEAGIEIGEYPPATVKLSVAGNGRAEKQQVQWMVRSLLRLDRDLAPLDVSDAVAVAICHASHSVTRVPR
jgi:crossover junction endodeoxyribonuclease RuvC